MARRAVWYLLALQMLAFWPVLRWYGARMTDSSDEPWGLLALVTAMGFIVLKSAKKESGELGKLSFILSSLFLVLYIVSYSALPPLGRAVLAVLSIACTLSATCLGRSVHLGTLGLLLLSLPIIASLQFYLGYPVRFITAVIAAKLITLTGFDVTASGTCLEWAGEIISVDAPCAGIRMLWSGLYLNFTLACFTGTGVFGTWLSYSLSMLAIFIANVLRATALFYLETGIVTGPEWSHTGIGIVAFAAVAVLIIMFHRFTEGERVQCA
ncbi:MAG: archaeosortase/exosortase family protein [Thermodesulfobacteriota bacterium]